MPTKILRKLEIEAERKVVKAQISAAAARPADVRSLPVRTGTSANRPNSATMRLMGFMMVPRLGRVIRRAHYHGIGQRCVLVPGAAQHEVMRRAREKSLAIAAAPRPGNVPQ